MCTALTYKTKDHYFGRNLDLEISYDEKVVITPRNYPFIFRKSKSVTEHYAMIGVAAVINDYPLYYDAVNEKGLGMAGLNFPQNAEYKLYADEKDNITPFEFIPWVLSRCENIGQAKDLLKHTNLVNISFSKELPLSPMHWIISDRNESITVESVRDGLKVYDNPIGILTNNPVFEMQMFNLNNYINLSAKKSENRFSPCFPLNAYSRGMGAIGLPGDFSSASRFVKAAFVKLNSVSGETENESINQFFHILGSVAHPRGSVILEDDKYEITVYSSCCNTDKGIYYYTTYENSRITAVDMCSENLTGKALISYPLIKETQINFQNKK